MQNIPEREKTGVSFCFHHGTLKRAGTEPWIALTIIPLLFTASFCKCSLLVFQFAPLESFPPPFLSGSGRMFKLSWLWGCCKNLSQKCRASACYSRGSFTWGLIAKWFHLIPGCSVIMGSVTFQGTVIGFSITSEKFNMVFWVQGRKKKIIYTSLGSTSLSLSEWSYTPQRAFWQHYYGLAK